MKILDCAFKRFVSEIHNAEDEEVQFGSVVDGIDAEQTIDFLVWKLNCNDNVSQVFESDLFGTELIKSPVGGRMVDYSAPIIIDGKASPKRIYIRINRDKILCFAFIR